MQDLKISTVADNTIFPDSTDDYGKTFGIQKEIQRLLQKHPC